MEKMRGLILLMMPVLAVAQGGLPAAWQKARDAQDRAALDGIAQAAAKEAEGKAGDAAALYRAALAESLRSEVAMEQRDKGAAGARRRRASGGGAGGGGEAGSGGISPVAGDPVRAGDSCERDAGVEVWAVRAGGGQQGD